MKGNVQKLDHGFARGRLGVFEGVGEDVSLIDQIAPHKLICLVLVLILRQSAPLPELQSTFGHLSSPLVFT
jgi:hypothetical protein